MFKKKGSITIQIKFLRMIGDFFLLALCLSIAGYYLDVSNLYVFFDFIIIISIAGIYIVGHYIKFLMIKFDIMKEQGRRECGLVD